VLSANRVTVWLGVLVAGLPSTSSEAMQQR
jgi:hypothetical protein